MAAKKPASKYGGAPKRNQRSKLWGRGYSQLRIDGNAVFTESQAKRHVERLHAAGDLAQALHIRDPDGGDWWVVMYKERF